MEVTINLRDGNVSTFSIDISRIDRIDINVVEIYCRFARGSGKFKYLLNFLTDNSDTFLQQMTISSGDSLYLNDVVIKNYMYALRFSDKLQLFEEKLTLYL